MAPVGKVVIAAVVTFKFGGDNNCQNSSLEIFNGPDELSPRITSILCGISYPKSVKSTGRGLFLKYEVFEDDADSFKVIYKTKGEDNYNIQ